MDKHKKVTEICPHCGAHRANYLEAMKVECEEAHPWTKLPERVKGIKSSPPDAKPSLLRQKGEE